MTELTGEQVFVGCCVEACSTRALFTLSRSQMGLNLDAFNYNFSKHDTSFYYFHGFVGMFAGKHLQTYGVNFRRTLPANKHSIQTKGVSCSSYPKSYFSTV